MKVAWLHYCINGTEITSFGSSGFQPSLAVSNLDVRDADCREDLLHMTRYNDSINVHQRSAGNKACQALVSRFKSVERTIDTSSSACYLKVYHSANSSHQSHKMKAVSRQIAHDVTAAFGRLSVNRENAEVVNRTWKYFA